MRQDHGRLAILLVVHGTRHVALVHLMVPTLPFNSCLNIVNTHPGVHLTVRHGTLLGFRVTEGAACSLIDVTRCTSVSTLQELRSLPTGQHLIHFDEDLLLLFQTGSHRVIIFHLLLQVPLIVE